MTKKTLDGFNRELLELAKKWKLQTKTALFSVTQHSRVENEVKTEHKAKRLLNNSFFINTCAVKSNFYRNFYINIHSNFNKNST